MTVLTGPNPNPNPNHGGRWWSGVVGGNFKLTGKAVIIRMNGRMVGFNYMDERTQPRPSTNWRRIGLAADSSAAMHSHVYRIKELHCIILLFIVRDGKVKFVFFLKCEFRLVKLELIQTSFVH